MSPGGLMRVLVAGRSRAPAGVGTAGVAVCTEEGRAEGARQASGCGNRKLETFNLGGAKTSDTAPAGLAASGMLIARTTGAASKSAGHAWANSIVGRPTRMLTVSSDSSGFQLVASTPVGRMRF